jgi:L-threonylcarbamoyladenylate synthase
MTAILGNDCALAARYLSEGKLVAIPTETVYGLGADAFNPIAVAKIFEAKKRPSFDPLIVHIADIKALDSLFAAPVSDKVYALAKRFWPGPLTIVYKKKNTVPDIVTSGLSSVAVRMPSHPMAREVIRLSGTAIAAPSANLFGHLSPTKAQHVAKQLQTIDYILDGGNTHFGIESTVVSIHEELVTLLRPGAISLEELRTIVPEIVTINNARAKQLESPGLMESHYSPRKPLYILEKNITTLPAKAGLLLVSDKDASGYKATEIAFLSKNCDLLEVAAKLFASLHAMEENNAVDCIYIEPVEEKGIGVAIMDRLRKAAYQYTTKKNG